MKRILNTLLISCIILGNVQAQHNTKPNVVIIYGDDVGYNDVGAYGSVMIPTPNIDRLAKEGLRFTDGHCTASTCTPSRYALLTGVYGFRDKINILPPNAPLTIDVDDYTLPRVFKDAGYKTGIVGKWHLGLGKKEVFTDWNGDVKPGPLELGFESSFLLPSTNDRVPCVYLEGHKVVNLNSKDPLYVGVHKEDVLDKNNTQYPIGSVDELSKSYYLNADSKHNETVINGIPRIGYMSGGKSALWNDEDMADKFVEKAKDYIKKNRKDPFFLYYSVQDIHVPRAPHKRFQGKTKLGYRGDAMVQFDWAVGQILKTLDKYNLTENTIVIFSSDNGPTYNDGYKDGTKIFRSYGENDRGHDASGIYRGGKGQIYEGGTRVPFIIRWPASIKPGVSNALVSQIDLLASFSKFLGGKIPENQARDSRNVIDSFLGENKEGVPFLIEETRKRLAIRMGHWKYIAPTIKRKQKIKSELYNLDHDPGEQNNIAFKHPDIVAKLDKKLKEIISTPIRY